MYKADTNTGAIKKLVDLPAKRDIVIVNADETLAAGTYIVGDATGKEYGANITAPAQPAGAADNKVASAVQGPHYQPTNKGAMMEARLAARLPLVLFKPATCSGPAISSEQKSTRRSTHRPTMWSPHRLSRGRSIRSTLLTAEY